MFFDVFQLWLLRVKVCRNRHNCLQTDSKEEFNNTVLWSFYQEWEIKIGYATLYIYKKKQYSKVMLKNISIDKRLVIYWQQTL